METNVPYQAQELANQASYMGAVALAYDGMPVEAHMVLIDAVAYSIIRMATANAEHWKRVIADRA